MQGKPVRAVIFLFACHVTAIAVPKKLKKNKKNELQRKKYYICTQNSNTANNINHNKRKKMNKEAPKKEQKISVSYTLKAFSNNIKKMHDAKLLTKEEEQELLKIHTTAVHRWIGLEFEVQNAERL